MHCDQRIEVGPEVSADVLRVSWTRGWRSSVCRRVLRIALALRGRGTSRTRAYLQLGRLSKRNNNCKAVDLCPAFMWLAQQKEAIDNLNSKQVEDPALLCDR